MCVCVHKTEPVVGVVGRAIHKGWIQSTVNYSYRTTAPGRMQRPVVQRSTMMTMILSASAAVDIPVHVRREVSYKKCSGFFTEFTEFDTQDYSGHILCRRHCNNTTWFDAKFTAIRVHFSKLTRKKVHVLA